MTNIDPGHHSCIKRPIPHWILTSNTPVMGGGPPKVPRRESLELGENRLVGQQLLTGWKSQRENINLMAEGLSGWSVGKRSAEGKDSLMDGRRLCFCLAKGK